MKSWVTTTRAESAYSTDRHGFSAMCLYGPIHLSAPQSGGPEILDPWTVALAARPPSLGQIWVLSGGRALDCRIASGRQRSAFRNLSPDRHFACGNRFCAGDWPERTERRTRGLYAKFQGKRSLENCRRLRRHAQPDVGFAFRAHDCGTWLYLACRDFQFSDAGMLIFNWLIPAGLIWAYGWHRVGWVPLRTGARAEDGIWGETFFSLPAFKDHKWTESWAGAALHRSMSAMAQTIRAMPTALRGHVGHLPDNGDELSDTVSFVRPKVRRNHRCLTCPRKAVGMAQTFVSQERCARRLEIRLEE